MKYNIILLLLWALTSCQSPSKETLSTSESNALHPVEKQIETVDFAQTSAIIKNKTVVIIDVRTAEEYRAGHIPHALNIDVDADNFTTQINNLNKEHHYLVYCETGVRSTEASEIMQKEGFPSIKNFKDGWKSWMQNNGKVEKSNQELK